MDGDIGFINEFASPIMGRGWDFHFNNRSGRADPIYHPGLFQTGSPHVDVLDGLHNGYLPFPHTRLLGTCKRQLPVIIDEDHYLPYWIYLTYRHLFCAQSEEEALGFLKSRGITHIIFSYLDLKELDMISALGSDERFDRLFHLIPLTPSKGETDRETLPLLPITSSGKIIKVELSEGRPRRAYLIEGQRVSPIKYIWYRGAEIKSSSPSAREALILFARKVRWRGFLLPEHGYRSLIIQLLLLNRPSPHFKLVYKNKEVSIWEVKYPRGITVNPSYLIRHFPSGELMRSWMAGR